MSDRRCARAAALFLIVAGIAGPVSAQEPLPPGHPPLPDGHPPTADAPALPPGHVPTEGTLPPDHAPTGEAPALPPGHAPTGEAPALPPGHVPTEGALPPGHVPTGTALPPGHVPTGGSVAPGDSGRIREVLRPPVSPMAVESDEVPVGGIRVLVVDENDQPVADQPVDVGALAAGERSRHNAVTDADGIALFADLPTGPSQHYRVNVRYLGAAYSTTPFALTTERGRAVRMVRLPVTQEDNYVFFHIFRVVVEQRGERMHVVHQGELTNAGTSTYVFPDGGRRAALPEGAVAFQFQRVMTDQRIEEIDGESGYVISGSLSPGTVRLAWAYDIPVGGGDLDIPVDLPLRFFGIQVIAEALPLLHMSIDGLPRPQRLDTQGNPCESSVAASGCAWVTQMQRGPEDARIEQLTIHLTGIPGPGPVRWIALLLASIFLLVGALWFILSAGGLPRAQIRTSRRDELNDEVEALAEEFEQGEIGPEYLARRRAEIVRELAGIFYTESIEEAAQETDRKSIRRARRSGPLGYLLPLDAMAHAARYVELALTLLSLPLMLLGLVFFAVRPRALGAMRGQAELVVSLVLGLASAAFMFELGLSVLHWDLPVTTTVIVVSGLALVLRTIVRTAAPLRSARRPA